MLPLLLFPTAVLLILGMAIQGWRLSRSTGLEDVEALYLATSEGHVKAPLIGRIVDAVGSRFQRTTLRLYGARQLAALESRLDRAGRPEGLRVADYVRRQTGFLAIGLFVFAIFWLAGQFAVGLIFFLLMSSWMELWLRQTVRKRQAAIARDLPDFLDILAVTVAAGLSLRSALTRVSEASDTPLGEEVSRVLEDMRLGLTRRQALEAMRDRNDVDALNSWISSMLQAEELGTPLSQALTDIASEVRRDRAAQVRKIAAKATPKVSLVVTTLIVPAALLLITSSLVLSQIDNFRKVLG